MRQDVTFNSEGADLSGWLYVPDSGPPWPLVVMAHGFSATRHMTADKYAEVFHKAGLAVLLYDHRGFGDSGGEPRQHSTRGALIKIAHVQEKYRNKTRNPIASWIS